MVVLDKHDYTNKAQNQLAKRDTYRPLKADPTNKHKSKLINVLRTIKVQGRLWDSTCKRVYPTGRLTCGLAKE